MKTRLQNLYETIRQSLWLVPLLSITFALTAAFAMQWVDRQVAASWDGMPFIYSSGPDASLSILSSITSSLITVAGVTFSITIVSLTLASSQFGPRLLRNFLRSFPSQITFGALVGSFVYGILIMSTIDSDWRSDQAHPSISLMILLASLCVCLLVYYIHHVATSIQADTLIAQVYHELEERIDSFEDRSQSTASRATEPPERSGAVAIPSWRSGYVNAIACERLLEWAQENKTVVAVSKRPGQFVSRGQPLAFVDSGDKAEQLQELLPKYVFLSSKRTPEQDIEFLIDQLVEIGLRAISPGINDPNTAIICIDYLSAALFLLMSKSLPPARYVDSNGDLRVFIPQTNFEGLLNTAFDQLRQHGSSYSEIIIRLGESLNVISAAPDADPRRLQAVQGQRDQLKAIDRSASDRAPKDQADIDEALVADR